MLKKLCFICLKKITTDAIWRKYCTKEIEKTRDILLRKNSHPTRVILNNHTVLHHKSTLIRQAVEYINNENNKKKTVLEYLENQ